MKNGLTLPEVAAAQRKDFANKPPEVKPLLEAGTLVLEPESAPREYYSPRELLQKARPSPGMKEYLSLKSFSLAAERKKISNLPKFFFVRGSQEKYHLLSTELSEPLLIAALNKAQRVGRLADSQRQSMHQLSKQGHTFEFEDGVSEVNEDIRRIVEEQFERQRNEAEQAKKRREAQLIFLKTPAPRKRTHSTSMHPIVTPTLSRESSINRHPLVEELLQLRSSSVPESPVRKRAPPKAQSPHQAIKENRRIQRNLYRFFSYKKPLD